MKFLDGGAVDDTDYSKYTYEVKIKPDGVRKKVLAWSCPYYKVWKSIVYRTLSEKFKLKIGTYKNVGICDEWKYFSNFKSWMETQDWLDMEIDKDFFSPNDGKIYSPETCIFIPQFLNSSMAQSFSVREFPTGVYIAKDHKSYTAMSARKHLGTFRDVETAHKAWQERKIYEIDQLYKQYKRMPCYNPDAGKILITIASKIKEDVINSRQTQIRSLFDYK